MVKLQVTHKYLFLETIPRSIVFLGQVKSKDTKFTFFQILYFAYLRVFTLVTVVECMTKMDLPFGSTIAARRFRDFA